MKVNKANVTIKDLWYKHVESSFYRYNTNRLFISVAGDLNAHLGLPHDLIHYPSTTSD